MVLNVVLDGVGFAVQEPTSVRILEPCSLDIEAGSSTAIVGPSGAGKSTLASIIGALQPPSEGRYRYGSVEVTALGRRDLAAFRGREVGFIFQNAHLIDERAAWHNVALGIVDSQPAADEVEDRSRAALASVGLSRVADREASYLSGGERQRVAIARALVKSPSLVLADEPTGALDQRTGRDVLELLHATCAVGTTLVVVTHDERAAALAGRVIQVVDGVVHG